MNKLKVAASAIGIFAGIGGASHGPGEMLQGNVAPSNIMIQAWPNLTTLGGEPAMTIVPSLLVAGILTIIFGSILAVWAAKFVSRKGGLALILLSILLFLVGGGIVPPLFGVAAGIIATAFNYRRARNGGVD